MCGRGYSWGYEEPEWDSEYDSTWEDDEDHKPLKQSNPKKKKFGQHSRENRAAQDLQRYRHGYPEPMLNLKFYQNKIPFEPYGVYIDYLHKYWKIKYDELEFNHNFIQWLFPLREPGMNRSAKPLTEKEMEEMKKDKAVMQRLLESYKLMLGFYGIELVDSETGKVARADNWRERFSNLNTNTHNNLRITRILKCLGELGYERYQVPLVKFFLEETLCHGNLKNVKTSALNYFMFTVKNKSERRELVLFAWEHYEPKEKFTWGPMEKLIKLKPPAPVEKPDNESDSRVIEYEDKRFQKNGHNPIFRNQKEKTECKKLPSEHGSIGKKSESQGPDSGNEKVNKEPQIEPRSEGDKETEDTPTESGSREDNENGGSQMRSESEDKRKGGPPMNSSLNDDIEKRGSPTEFWSEDKANGEQPMQSGAANDKEDKGPTTESESVDSKEKEGAPSDSMSDNDKEDRKTPTVSDSGNEKVNKESPVESKSVGDKENEETPSESREDNENGGSQLECETEDKRKGGPPMRSGLNDDIEKRGSPTEFGSEDKVNGKQPMQSGAPIDSMSGNDKENKKPPKDDQENGAQSMQSGAVDDKSKTLPPTFESEDDKENKETPRGSGSEEENREESMLSRSADDKNNRGPSKECESGNVIGVERENQDLPTGSG